MIEELESVVREQMAEWQIPGISLAITHGGVTEFATWGSASIATNQPAREDTLFQIGSISKIFTTTLILTLVDEGKLDLDTPVIKWIPDLPLTDGTARTTITLRHLVTHMGGFYGDRFDDHGRGDDALERKIAAFYDLPQQTAPGELWTYCNAGFDLAARVAEIVTGETFENLVRTRIFEPLGLDTITYFPDEAIRNPVSVGHEFDDDRGGNAIASPWPIPRCSNGAGGISATTNHLLRFARMHLNDGELEGKRVLKAESAQAMRAFQTNAEPHRTWGLGWQRKTVDGVHMVGHGGATNGFTAKLTLVPEKDLVLVILTNSNRGSSAYPLIEKAAFSSILGLEIPEPTFVELPAATLAKLAGTYTHDLATTTLTAVEGGLAATVARHNPFDDKRTVGLPYTLRPTSATTFLATGRGSEGAVADFTLNADGTVRFYRIGGRLGYPV